MKLILLPTLAVLMMILPTTNAFAAEVANDDAELSQLINLQTSPPNTSQPFTAVSQYCCRKCRKGKACGNSCISAHLQCHQPPGCACD